MNHDALSLSNSTFTNNKADNQGAILGFRYPISLHGTNNFTNNAGGAVRLLQTRLDASGTIWFEGNTAMEGAAIAMEDQCLVSKNVLKLFAFYLLDFKLLLLQLQLFQNVSMTFLNNSAEKVGGAISIQNPSVGLDVIQLFNTRCFIQYEVTTAPNILDPNLNWTVSIEHSFSV